MQVLQAQQDLFGDIFYETAGNTFLFMSRNERKQVFAEGFKDHADMRGI